jgi:hypothetical protein
MLKVDFTEIGILSKFYQNKFLLTKFSLLNFVYQFFFY